MSNALMSGKRKYFNKEECLKDNDSYNNNDTNKKENLIKYSEKDKKNDKEVNEEEEVEDEEEEIKKRKINHEKSSFNLNIQEDGSIPLEISNKRKVTIRKWNAIRLIDIREYYNDSGVSKPGKKGISLSIDQFKIIKKLNIKEAMEAVKNETINDFNGDHILSKTNEEISFRISPKRQVTIKLYKGNILVDIREYYETNQKEMKPGKKGISLSEEQWNTFTQLFSSIDEALQLVK